MKNETVEVISRKEALAKGLTKYSTGKACRFGHLSHRSVSDGACSGCRTKQARRHAEKHRHELRKYQLSWRNNNLESERKKDAERAKLDRKANPEKGRLAQQRYKQKRYERIAQELGRPKPLNCEICHDTHKIVYDHCHKTEKARGWICDRCNKTLGMVKDSPTLLRKLAEYLGNGPTYQ